MGKLEQRLVSGPSRKVSLTWSNSGSTTFEANVHGHLEQATSASAAPVSDFPWKKLQVLPGQTILESAQVNFPDVRARTEFLIRWLDHTNHVLGRSRVFVYPTNLLLELKSMAGDDDLGLFDPANILKPILKTLGIQFSDLEDTGIAAFRGQLAILGPFVEKRQMPEDLAQRAKAAASKGVALVWLQSAPQDENQLVPSFYCKVEGKGFVLVAQSQLVANLSEDPRSQLNLLSLCRRAIKRDAVPFADLPHSYEN